MSDHDLLIGNVTTRWGPPSLRVDIVVVDVTTPTARTDAELDAARTETPSSGTRSTVRLRTEPDVCAARGGTDGRDDDDDDEPG